LIGQRVAAGRSRILSLVVLLVAALVLAAIAYARGGLPLVGQGLGEGASLLGSVLPQVVIGFALAGLITVLVPAGAIAAWVGEGSGIRGLLIATVAGALTPGGPFVQFPLVATLSQAGAAAGPMAAYLTAWSVLGFQRVIVWELPILGGPFSVARWAVSLALPMIVGLVVPPVLRMLTPR
jgi:uncharacterized membrane protein YraQ (UPF0718 family)